MNVKEQLLEIIKNEHQDEDHYLTTNQLAEKIDIKRNTVSHYLNQLVKENKLIKINTRPAIFIDKETAEKKAKGELKNEYDSIQSLHSEYQHQDVFASVIGNDKSLYSQIKKLKAAASYP